MIEKTELPRGLHEFFSHDHARLDNLFHKCMTAGFENSQEDLEEFARGLIQHIIWEDEYLFPVFEHVSGMSDKGPTFVMRADHHTIQELLYELIQGVRNGTLDMTLPSTLQGLLLQHNQAEENVVYEAVESMLTPESREELLAHLKATPPLDLEAWIESVVEVEELEYNSGASPFSMHECN
mgnify:CR=1 FL=1